MAWSQSLCQRALQTGLRRTSDAPRAFPDTDIATRLGIVSYAAEPVYDQHGQLYGTLCAAAPTPVPLNEGHSATLRLFARLIADKLPTPPAKSPTVSATAARGGSQPPRH